MSLTTNMTNMEVDSPKDCLISSASTSTKRDLKTWVEKYRPSKLDEVVYQHEVISSLQNIVAKNPSNLPNLLLYGPPGTGKTSTIIALSKELFGQHFGSRVLELNASDERGIQVIREKVKNFAQLTISHAAERSIPPIKIVVLDECDSMTRDAQSALRRIMEKHTISTRFCLICNYASKIIDPIVSRCTVYRFKPLQRELVQKTLLTVAQKEDLQISANALDSLIDICEGDLRRSMTLLQTATLITKSGQELSQATIWEISGYVPQSEIESFFHICNAKSFNKMVAKVNDIIKNGYSVSQFFDQLQEWIARADGLLLNDAQKAAICQQVALNDKRLLDGADEYLQLCNVGACIIHTLNTIS